MDQILRIGRLVEMDMVVMVVDLQEVTVGQPITVKELVELKVLEVFVMRTGMQITVRVSLDTEVVILQP